MAPKIKWVEVLEEDRFAEDFKEPSTYFIVNAFNNAVFFFTSSRQKAQDMSDELYGKNHYIVRKVIRAQVR